MNRILSILTLGLLSLLFLSACKEEVIIDPTQPSGAFTASRTGTFIAQNATGSAGMASLGTDEDGAQFLKLGSDFTTNFATGTVTVYLSKGQTYTADPANGNPSLRLLGVTRKAGEQYFKLETAVGADFTHVILWCASANVPFGYAPLN
ncbi:MAG: hypothetical protein EAZ89_06005 [Bacteroidetes bacterium]|jgi:hypothetical protein|nr:MAG: hypothetical protein EAZ89_06005 [Bacteroidota bacterium]